ncbi:SGNH/GDSL hydrolase family protein [Sphingomonas yantingensis]|uniref:Lysophospholipase L1-like esterase n=1 Tax=Sphingomonas yantingensis TaxID=1241761 RepID=A0A7W9ANU0_9SPHN|nr:SGNH/GDSL hydrolase family protein [Sphingomonas yantingensis]MBB5697850.1 lysophospholipase L1-like esterase [Sphingomonas yantingensis]
MRRTEWAITGLALLSAAPAWASSCGWQPAWVSAQMVPGGDNRLVSGAMTDASLRQTVRVSAGGPRIRIRISNAFGTKPLIVRSASIARPVRPGAAAVQTASLVPIRFGGRAGMAVPPGSDWLSDPVEMPVAAFDDLSVTLHVAGEPGEQTSHPGSRATSWLAKGDATRDPAMAVAAPTEHWFNLSGVEVEACGRTGAVVVLGDSITDGRGSTTNGNDRWPDLLARRLAADRRTRGMAVLNQGIGGNRVLADGLGPSALARLDRDVLALAGVTDLIVFEGVNDIGTLSRTERPIQADADALFDALTGAYAQIAARARARGLRVHGATITPFGASDYYHATPLIEGLRTRVNAWIRTPGHFDGVIDLDRVVADPARLDRLAAAFDTGDGLHPNPAGFARMAAAVPIGSLKGAVAGGAARP